MGWRDRDYNQSGYGTRGTFNPLMWLFMGSIPLGTWFGIRVRAHVTLLAYAIFQLFVGQNWTYTLASIVVLFGIVLLHEFGHCIGARLVGGSAEEILLWILGGLAFTSTARRPWARFMTVAAGPAVNVIICLITGSILWGMTGTYRGVPFNPVLPFIGKFFANDSSWQFLGQPMMDHPWLMYVWLTHATSLSILFFNLLPIYPMDGGKLAQILLWKPLGYYKSMNVSCIIGMVAAVAIGLAGLATQAFILTILAVTGFWNCLSQRRALLAEGPHAFADDEVDYSAGIYNEGEHRRRRAKKGWFKAAARRAAKERAEQAQIDAILAKVHDKGLHSLSWFEKRALRKATERQRQRDLAERL